MIVLDPLRALRVDGLKGCHVLSGPIAGSVLLHACEASVFMLCARQLRIHTSQRCSYYLRCMSRPIIEKCDGLGFAPYALEYEGRGAAEATAALDRPVPGMWRNVDDFLWHRVQKSPAWDVIPCEKRLLTLPAAAAERGLAIDKTAAQEGSDENSALPLSPATVAKAAAVAAAAIVEDEL